MPKKTEPKKSVPTRDLEKPKTAADKAAKKEDDNKEILETLRSIKTKFGDDAIMTLDETKHVDIASVPTGSIGLDDALGIGGLPRGRIIEIFGPESSGKTTLSLHAVAEAQKDGGICAFIDAEHAMDPEYAKNLGVKLDELLISQPDNGEQALEIVESLVRSGKLDVIVVDSVAALTPRDEIEGEMGAHHVGKQARLMSQALRKLTGIVAKSKTVVIFINQIRMQVGVMFGNPETTPGGKALKFYTSVRLDIRRIAQIKKGDEVVGGRHRVKVVKNKVANTTWSRKLVLATATLPLVETKVASSNLGADTTQPAKPSKGTKNLPTRSSRTSARNSKQKQKINHVDSENAEHGSWSSSRTCIKYIASISKQS